MSKFEDSKSINKARNIAAALREYGDAKLKDSTLETAMLFAVAIDNEKVNFEDQQSEDIAHSLLALVIETADRELTYLKHASEPDTVH